MASIILGLLLLGFIRPHAVRGNAQGPMTYDAAKIYCENLPSKGRLPLYMDPKGQTAVTKEMGEKGYTSVWLPVKRKYIGWELLNNTNADKKFAEQPWPSEDACGILHLPNRVRQAAKCYIKRGYICQSNDSCTVAQKYCFREAGVTYHYQCEKMNWYEAREKCEKDGKVLALITELHSTKMINEMRKKWHQGLKEECDKVWIGLRKDEWEYDGGSTKTGVLPPAQYWDAGEPNGTGNCVILQKKQGGTYVWKATHCSKEVHVTCRVVVDVQMTVKPGVIKDQEGARAGLPPWIIIVIVLAVVALLVTVVIFGILRWRKKKSCRRSGDDESGPKKDIDEMERLNKDEPDHTAIGTAPSHDPGWRDRFRQQREEGEDYCGLEEEDDEEEDAEEMLDDHLSKFSWYHGSLRRSKAQELIKNPGDYLVYRADAEKAFVLVIGKANNSVVHHPIEVLKSSSQSKEEATDVCGLEEEEQDEHMLKCNGVTFTDVSDIEKDENFKKALELVSPVVKEAA